MTMTTQQRDAVTAPVSRLAKWAPLAVILCGTFVYIVDFFVVDVGAARASSATCPPAPPPSSGWWPATGSPAPPARPTAGDSATFRTQMCAPPAGGVRRSPRRLRARPRRGVPRRRPPRPRGRRSADGPQHPVHPRRRLHRGAAGTSHQRVRDGHGDGGGGGAADRRRPHRLEIASLGWRAIFWVNVPIGLVALAAAGRLVPESRAERAGHLDLPGAALLAAGLVAIVLPLADGRHRAGPPGRGRAWRSARCCWRCSPSTSPVRRGAGRPLLDAVFAVRTLRVGLIVQAPSGAGRLPATWCWRCTCSRGGGWPLASGGVFCVLAGGYLMTSLRAPARTFRFGRG